MAARVEAPQQGLSWDPWLTVQPPLGPSPVLCLAQLLLPPLTAELTKSLCSEAMVWAPEALEARGWGDAGLSFLGLAQGSSGPLV